MPTDKPPIWTFLLSAPDKKGLLEAFGSTALASPESFVSFSGIERKIRLVRSTGDDENPHEDVPIDGANLLIALGALSIEPTDGSSYGTYDGVAAGLTPLPAGATALQMETLLNASAGITADGGVTVTKGRTGYRVEWNNVGARPLVLEWFAGSLTPAARTSVTQLIEGDADKREVRLVKIIQDYWGATEDWDLDADGSLDYEVITDGAEGVREVSKVTITGVPTSGQFKILAPQSAVHKITAISNVFAGKATYTFVWALNTIASGDYVDVTDGAGPVRIWFNIAGAGPAPAIPVGGRLFEVAAATTSSSDLGAALWAALVADSGLEQGGTTFGYPWVAVQNKTLGHVATPLFPGFVDFQFQDGSSGRLDGKYFTVTDAYGPVGIWFNLSGITDIPAAAAANYRTIEVTGIAGNATAADVATAIKLALDADGAFSASVASNIVTVTDEVGGARVLPSSGDSAIGIFQTVQGYIITASIPYNASAAQVRDALLGLCDVTKTATSEAITYVLSYVDAGEQPNLLLQEIELVFSRSYAGSFSINTDTMLAAFEETDADYVTGILQGQYQFPGEDPVVFYYSQVTVFRSLVDTGEINPLNTVGSNYAQGSEAVGLGDAFVDVVFDTPLANANYTVITGYLENAVDAPPDVIATGTVADKTTDGYRHYLTGAPATANFVYKYIVRL